MIKWKTLVAGASLALVPGLAMAQGCGYDRQQVTMSCAPGMSLDAETNTCVAEVTS